ncbi:MAG: glycyl-tRNA ligase subunit beta [Pseudomonadota bacterium]|jgi:glycyl-tRNA synthetase beta chain
MSNLNESHVFFVELGTEELPPKALLSLQEAFAQHINDALAQAGISFNELKAFASPRRLALRIEGIAAETPRQAVTHWGPPAKMAKDDSGAPSKAALAFADKLGVGFEQLQVANDGKIDKLSFQAEIGGEPVQSLMAGFVANALAALPIPKRMRWGASRNEFVRPALWLVMLWDNQILPAEILGIKSSNQTRGHRIHAPNPITLSDARRYEVQLKDEGFVLADFAARRALVADLVKAEASKLAGHAVIDADLLDEVTALVEWPVALAGRFEERFLQVPAEALISSMKEHQKYFHLVDAQGALMPYFITLANLASLDPAQVIAGNEKVIRPRLSDAAFFFTTDCQTRLDVQRDKLKTVMFQAQLGSLFDKSERLAHLAGVMADLLGWDVSLAQRAGELSKADLTSKMVYEFAEMQGIAGYYYALNDGEALDVALAIKEQYLPRFAGDELPESHTGCLLALADRLDTLVGIFGIGQIPTGSKDPFALRRASVGALRILIEKRLDLDLKVLLQSAIEGFKSLRADTLETALAYVLERLASVYSDQGISPEVYQAVSAKNLSNPLDIHHRIQAVAAFSQLPQAASLAAANKRVSNILAKLPEAPEDKINPALLQLPAEQALAAALNKAQAEVGPLLQDGEYQTALTQLAVLQAPVDGFFADVMVMADDLALRNNRLALLQQLRDLFWQVADISCLVVK